MTYAVVSDIHAYNWSAFGGVDDDGVSTRLRTILDELERAADELIAAGGRHLYIPGDIFHTRGSIDPEVFNPTHEAFKRILAKGVEIYAIPGNHDLKGRETNKLGNAIQTLSDLTGFHVITRVAAYDIEKDGGLMAFVPWCSSTADLRAKIDTLMEDVGSENVTLFIHAGIDGVIPGMPDHGLSATELAAYGFKHVFAGHYHNHKVMEGGIVSVGALTHQTWGDIGSKAGFLLVDGDKVNYRASHAPNFVEVTGETDPDDLPMIVDGNYVRIRGMKLTDSDITTMRLELKGMGALGVTFQVARETVTARTAGAVAKARSLDESVEAYVDTLSIAQAIDLKKECADILGTVRSIAA